MGTITNDDYTLYVRNGGAGAGNGMNWGNAYSNVQQAVTAIVQDVMNPTWVINVEASTGVQEAGIGSGVGSSGTHGVRPSIFASR